MNKLDVLKEIRFGNQVAEEERDQLRDYFVQTQSWRKIIRGDVDVIYGAKGSGKSALYLLVQDHVDELFDKGTLLVVAENPRGAPAFRDLKAEPPTSERDFVNIWKLYFISLLGREIEDYGISNDSSKELVAILRQEGLLPEKGWSLGRILSGVRSYIAKYANPTSAESTLHLSDTSGNPIGVSGKITFSESNSQENRDSVFVDDLYKLADDSLSKQGNVVWLLLDRLDVAFDDSDELERNALRALFKAYRDIRSFERVILKIFLRTDIWERITDDGFREATHISREIRLEWDKPSLMNLVVRRFISNRSLTEFYGVDADHTASDVQEQLSLLDRILPAQVEAGERQSETFDWILKRTTDGSGSNAPREIIVFFNELIDAQVRRLERGETAPPDETLFDRSAFKDALPPLSEYRLTKVLYAENPRLKRYLEALDGHKSEHNVDSLSRIWGTNIDETKAVAEELRKVGFFEYFEKGKTSYKIPFIYRPSLNIVQGKAEEIQ